MSVTITESIRPEVLSAEDQHKYDFDQLTPYTHPPETQEALPWAELVTLDLEDYNRPGGKERLAKQRTSSEIPIIYREMNMSLKSLVLLQQPLNLPCLCKKANCLVTFGS